MSEDNMGVCRFCGQSTIVETIGEVTQEKRDEIATDICQCEGAKSEHRKKERAGKIKKYLDQKYETEDIRQLLSDGIRLVENQFQDPTNSIESIQIKDAAGYTTKISLNNDYNLCVSRKKTESEDVKF